MTQMLLVFLFFAACMLAMSVGLLLQNQELQGSCGGAGDALHEAHGISCGGCSKKEAEVCPSDDPLVALAQIGHPNPEHHR